MITVWGFSQIPYDGTLNNFETAPEASTPYWTKSLGADSSALSFINIMPVNNPVAEGAQSMQIDYAVQDAESWGGFSEINHILPDSQVYDFSGYDSISFYYYVAAPSSRPGELELRFDLMDVSDSPNGNSETDAFQSELYYSFHKILDDDPGWHKQTIALISDPDTMSAKSFNRTGWVGIAGNDKLDLDKIKNIYITMSFLSGDSTMNSAYGSIVIDRIALTNPTDSLALVAFYDSLGGDGWTTKTNWKTAKPIDTWSGVTVTAGHVTKLQMINNNLTGVIPAAVGDLDSLEQLLVGADPIGGPLPQSLFNLKKLFHLYITNTGMGGAFPADILNLTNLEYLELSGNGFTGNLPAGISSLKKLESIRVGSNNLGPTLPSELESVPLLNDLWIESNNYSGSFPLFLTNMPQMQSLNISNNSFSGLLPPEIGNFVNLSHVYWSGNNFSGEIPAEVGKMVTARFLELNNNNFTGAIPDSIVNMSSIQYLRLQGNQLSGAVPPEIAQMTELKEIRVDDNMLTDFPDVSALPSIATLRLNNNQFSFADIEPNVGIGTYYYSPQDSMGQAVDTTLISGTSYDLYVEETAPSDVYQWYKDGAVISGADTSTLQLGPLVQFVDDGAYSCTITNNAATELTIYTRPVTITVTPTGRQTDSLALVSIYNSLDGPNWTDNTNWLTPDSSITTWSHVTVSGGRVTQLNLNNNNISGTIPPEIGNLSALGSLAMDGAGLTGTLPPQLGNLLSLWYLGITSSNISGTIPPELGNLANLNYLYLYFNSNLGGSIPPELGNLTNLTALYLSSNNLSGPVPPELGNLSSLTSLYLFDNSLSDTLPASIGNLVNLQEFQIYNNNFSGELPPALGNLSNISVFSIYLNNFTGSVPSSFATYPSLTYLDVGDNLLTTLPDLSGATGLTDLYIGNNRFTFEDIEPNMAVTNLGYIPQDSVGRDTTILVAPGGSIVLRTNVGGTQNWYTWYLSGSEIPSENVDTLLISNADELSDEGSYTYTVTSPLVSGLTLYSRTINVDVNPDAGLVAYYPFNGNALDESVNGNDGTENGGVALTSDRFGNENSAYSFDGADDYIETFLFSEQLFTVSFWMKTGISNSQYIFSNMTEAGTDGIGMFNSTGMAFASGGGGAGIISTPTSEPVYDEKWHHVIGIYDDNSKIVKIYVDNVKEVDEAFNSLTYNDLLIFGKRGQATSPYFYSGKLDDIRIYNRLISQSEIDSLYHLNGWNGGNDLTFQVDMSVQQSEGLFDPAVDTVQLRGGFNGWNSTTEVMSDPDEDGIYTITHYIEGLTDDYIEYKFVFVDDTSGVNWEQDVAMSPSPDNRIFYLTGGPETLPVVYYGNKSTTWFRERDSLALVAMYDNLGGDNWAVSSGWKSDILDNWYGITMLDNRVFSIDLSANNLIGEIPAEIGDLSALNGLFLGVNNFGAPAKTGSTRLSKIEMMEALENPRAIEKTSTQNKIAGGLPAEIGRLSNLQYLNLNNNNLSAALPAEMGDLNNLLQLNLSGNPLSELQLPPELGSIATLNSLSLDHMNIDNFPAFITSLTNLTYLELWHNNLTSIPSEIGNLTNLAFLDLDENQISTFPEEFANLTALTQLWISNPLVEVPTQIAYFTNLQILGIWGSGLDDSDVADINRFPTSLVSLFMHSNYFTVVPPVLSDLPNLVYIDLSGNQITNAGLSEFSTFSSLTGIRLAENLLEGFPSEVLGHSNLIRLDLQHNNISGAVPPEINNLDTLQTLLLYHNHFTSLPALTLSNLNYLYVDSNNLDFGDIEPNVGVPLVNFRYVPQYPIGAETDTTINQGESFTLSVNVGGTSNLYQWYHDNNPISGANGSSLTINGFDQGDVGDYFCEITNTAVPDLTIYSQPTHTNVAGGITYFQVDMSVAMVNGLFNPSTDSVVIGGTIQGSWASSPPFEDQGRFIYMIDAHFDSTFGNSLDYTYMIKYANGDSLLEYIPLRNAAIVNYDTTLAPVFFNDDNTISIEQLQTVADPAVDDASIFNGKHVNVDGMVMNNPREIYLGPLWGTFIQDSNAGAGTSYNGLMIIQNDTTVTATGFQDVKPGDYCTFSGIVMEYHGFTEMALITDPPVPVVIQSSGGTLPEPLIVNSVSLGSTAMAEQYEGMLVHIDGATVVNNSIGYGEAELTDIYGDDFYLDDYFKLFHDRISVNGETWASNGSVMNITGFVTDLYRDTTSLGYRLAPRDDADLEIFPSFMEQDSLALVDFYNSTGGTAWHDTSKWNLYQPVSSWPGVAVANGRVTELQLINVGLSGTLPGTIGNLSALQVLDLSDNAITGSIPATLGSLSQLTFLRIKGCQLSGSIPPELGNLSSMDYFNLRSNNLSGSIPAELGLMSTATSIRLYYNNLTGTIPKELGNIPNLQTLHLYGNQLEGAVPPEIGNLSKLEYFSITENHLTDLPDLSGLSSLQYFWVENNNFTFEDIVPNINVAATYFSYSPQDSVAAAKDTVITPNSTITLDMRVGGTGNSYMWIRSTSAGTDTLFVSEPTGQLGYANGGYYRVNVTNPVAPDLILYSYTVHVIEGSGNFLTFNVNMDVKAQEHVFDPVTDELWVRGSFNNWLSGSEDWNQWKLTDNDNDKIYTGTFNVGGASGDTITFKYFYQHGGYDIWEQVDQRSFVLTGSPESLAPVYFDDDEVVNVISQDVTVLFRVDMNDAADFRNGQLFQDIHSVWMDGGFIGWNSWNLADTAGLVRLYDDGANGGDEIAGDNIWTTSQLFPIFSNPDLQYKYGCYADTVTFLDNEAGFGDDHFATINSENSTFILPIDQWKTKVVSDSLALVAFYDSLGGDAWTNKTNWKTVGKPIDTWFGLTVQNGRVTEINLQNNNLAGHIPAAIGYLTALETLDLGANQIGDSQGKIGDTYFADKMEYLITGKLPENKNSNKISGQIPAEIGNLTALRSLILSYNLLNEALPTEIGNLVNLQVLDLNNNQLGNEDLPASMGDLSSLNTLLLYENDLTSYPDFISNLTNLTLLNLWRNSIPDLPATIGNLINLESLDIDELGLTTLPDEITNLVNLKQLYLSDNFGGVPSQIQAFTQLETFGLYNSGLNDADLTAIADFPVSIKTLNLIGNNLTVIPPILSDFTALESVYLRDNQIGDQGMGELAQFNTLTALILSYNQLTVFPQDALNHTNLEVFSLHHNSISGAVPDEINNLVNMDRLYVNNNMFDSMPTLTFEVLTELYANDNRFTFEDIQPNIAVPQTYFQYAPQDTALAAIDTLVATGTSVTVDRRIGGSGNLYDWYKSNDGGISWTLVFENEATGQLLTSEVGLYRCEVTNAQVPGLTINTRKYGITNATGNTIKFQVNMGVKIAENLFDPATDTLWLRGGFNDWLNSGNWDDWKLTDINGDNIFTGVFDVGPNDTTFTFKYFFRHSGLDVWEDIADRSFVTTGQPQTLPVVYFSDDEVVNSTAQDVTVLFRVDMNYAVDYRNDQPFGSIHSVWLTGSFNGWPSWSVADTSNLVRLYDDGTQGGDEVAGDNIWSANYLYPAFSNPDIEYKYGCLADTITYLDNESGFGDNHILTIDDANSSFTPPVDQWKTKVFPDDPSVRFNIATEYCGNPSISPDGSKLVYMKAVGPLKYTIILSDIAGDYTATNALTISSFTGGTTGNWGGLWRKGFSNEIYFLTDKDGPEQVYVYNTTQKTETLVFNVPEGDFINHLRFSPDGSQFVCTRIVGTTFSIAIYNADGTNPTNIYSAEGGYSFRPDWSPDGSQIVFGENNSIKTIDIDGGNLTTIFSDPAHTLYDPRWSPDGAKIAFNAIINGNYDLWVVDVSGDNLMSVTSNAANDYHPEWDAANRRIFFDSNRDADTYNIWSIDASSLIPEPTAVALTFRVNMNVQMSDGVFRPGDGHQVVVRGDFDDWGNDGEVSMTDANLDGVFEGTWTFDKSSSIVYKFAIKESASSVVYESGENRTLQVPDLNTTLPIVFFSNQAIPAAFHNDSLAVVGVYNAVAGSEWTNHGNWLTSQPLSTWFGVTVSNYRVTKLELSDNNLVGFVPPVIGNLSELEILVLQNNSLSGIIPNDFGNLANLTYLDMGDNDLTGAIPKVLGNLHKLRNLYLQNNGFSGAIPDELAGLTALRQVDLNNNDLNGGVPTNWTNLTALEVIRLSNNDFDQLPNLSSLSNITTLTVGGNALTFEDIVPNIGISEFIYVPQDSVGDIADSTKYAGEAFSYTIDVGGSDNEYEWIKDGTPQGLSTNTLSFSSLMPENDGEYILKITNKFAPALTLYSYPLNLHVVGGLAIVQALSVEAVTVTTVDLSASINPNYLSTSVEFEYGTTNSYGTIVSAVPSTLNGSNVQTATVHIDGLQENTGYHFNVRVGNAAGLANGNDATFTTRTYPTVETPDTTITTLPKHTRPSQYTSVDYRMVGLPGNTGKDIGTLLSGVSETDWMVYWDNGNTGTADDYLVKYDGSSQFHLSVGRAFWVVAINDIPVNFNITMPALTNNDEISIPLHSGWNLITNPFLQQVSWPTVQAGNGITWKLNLFHGTWDKNHQLLKPFLGYMVYNADGRNSLKIPYPTSLSKMPPAALQTEWAVGVMMSYADKEQHVIEFGIAPDASVQKDELEFHTPRMFADVPDAWFERKEWDENNSAFSEDFRPVVDELQSWTFNAVVPKNETVSFNFSGLKDIPEEYEVVIFDQQLMTSQSLSEDPVYTITSPQTKRSFEVLVGEPDMVDEKLATMLPQIFTLEPNFPNPFNPTTVIPVEIPRESDVTVEIFDVLGKRVKVLQKGVLSVGRHLLTWDGRNAQGSLMSSGVYFYRMRTSSGDNVTRKMILMK